MLRKLNLIAALLATFALATSSFASILQTVDLSTGVNVGVPGNPLYPVNGRDDYWRVRSVPPGTVFSTSIQAWIVSFGGGWNNLPGAQPIFGNNNSIGTTEYERCFCLQSTEKAQLSLVLRADNKANLFLNSYFANPIMQALVNNTFGNNVAPVQYTYTAQNGLKAGKNCIRVRVNNEGGPTGFALKATLQGFGAQDAAEACCTAGGPVFAEALRRSGTELDPAPTKGAAPAPEVTPERVSPSLQPNP